MQNDKEKFKTEFRNRLKLWTLQLIKLHDAADKDPVGKIIFNQLIRSGTSVGANYIEAQASSSKKDFINFLHHALKSANESKFWLEILRDSKRAPENEINKLMDEAIQISNILGSSLLTLKGKNKF